MPRAEKPHSGTHQTRKLLHLGCHGRKGGGRGLLASRVLNLRLRKEEIITTISTPLQPQHFPPGGGRESADGDGRAPCNSHVTASPGLMDFSLKNYVMSFWKPNTELLIS